VFVIWENHVDFPVLKVSLFSQNMVFAMSSLAAFISYSAVWAVAVVVSMYMQYIKGMEAWSAGLVMIAQPVVQAVFSPVAGRISDHVEPRIIASIGMALSCAGLGMLAFLDAATDIWYIVFALVVTGFGFAAFVTPNTHAIMSSTPKNSYGIASALISTMRTTGQMAGMGIVTVLLALIVGIVQITPEHYANFVLAVKAIFAVFSLLCLIATVTSLFRGKLRNEEDSAELVVPDVSA
jgi:MFS family permease